MSELSYLNIKQLFKHNGDVLFQQISIEQELIYVVTCESMIDEKMLYDIVLPAIQSRGQQSWMEFIERSVLPQLQIVTTEEQVESLIFNGYCVVIAEQDNVLFAVNVASKPNRSPEETKLEALVKGPRDNFIEHLPTNIALIRKRLPSKSLAVHKLNLGKRSQTAVSVIYFHDVVNPKLIDEIIQQLKKVDIDIVFSGELLMEMINKKAFLFPRFEYTGRPDFVVQSLARGRVAIIAEGSSYAMVTPINFFFLLKSGEDNEFPFMYSSLQRILRLIGLLMGLLLPAFWLALTTFHQNQIPLQLLATVVQSNTGSPFPSAMEMLLMVLFFELFREAGLRLPSVIGSTISVVGGLIIGDAAIRSGITSAAMVVVIALSTIASYTLGNQSIAAAINILRIIFIVVTALFGLYGFFICCLVTIMYMANIKVFGVPYLNVSSELTLKNWALSVFRLRVKAYGKRPEMLKPVDKTRNRRAK